MPDPTKPKRSKSAIEEALKSVEQRPDALPARPRGPKLYEYQQVPIPLPVKAPEAHGSVPGTNLLNWQQAFFDTLSTLAGVPGDIKYIPDAGPVSARFIPRGQRVEFEGNVMQHLGGDPKDIRAAAGHEWGHIISHNDDRILKAFMGAAPLPKRLNTYISGVSPTVQKAFDDRFAVEWVWTPELPAGEAFADMFRDALAKKLPQMYGTENQSIQYPFTDQFRGRMRQRMVDSLVSELLPRLK